MERFEITLPAEPAGEARQTADCYAQAVRLGWTPAAPALDRNPLELADEAAEAGVKPADYVVEELKAGRLGFACEDPDDPANFPRILNLWRANLLGSSSKGHEYFLKHLLGTDSGIRSAESDPEHRPRDVGQLDEGDRVVRDRRLVDRLPVRDRAVGGQQCVTGPNDVAAAQFQRVDA